MRNLLRATLGLGMLVLVPFLAVFLGLQPKSFASGSSSLSRCKRTVTASYIYYPYYRDDGQTPPGWCLTGCSLPVACDLAAYIPDQICFDCQSSSGDSENQCGDVLQSIVHTSAATMSEECNWAYVVCDPDEFPTCDICTSPVIIGSL